MTMQSRRGRAMAADTPRNRHYGHFYAFDEVVDDGRPLLLVHGNCQAESLRVMLEGRYGDEVATARLVPAHELSADDVPHLMRLLARARYLVTQPIVDGYRGIGVGSRQLLGAAPHVAAAVVPVLRWAGLHPSQAIVRTPAGDPPIVPYHDLRTVSACLRGGARPELTLARAAALRELSLAELTTRIEAHGALPVQDVLTRAGARTVHVINHPSNDVLEAVADRVAAHLGLGGPRAFDPGRVLLGGIVAPVGDAAAQLAGLERTRDDTDDVWRIGGMPVPDAEIEAAHRAWYAEHPQALADAARRHARALSLMEAA